MTLRHLTDKASGTLIQLHYNVINILVKSDVGNYHPSFKLSTEVMFLFLLNIKKIADSERQP